MTPALRRLIAVEAHRRAAGRIATLVHSLGTGESFAVRAGADGFTDEESGLSARLLPDGALEAGASRIRLTADGDVLFRGQDLTTGERLTGRAGGGAIVTLYDGDGWFQYHLVTDGT
ncbi:hypothetical protein ACE7GA_03310 [Roseomonas sp. CCTCC AB2023176]|uniref:hypothetical protein n=1 Tax=Roseomonas sp. CCTCC AB2023176 TaxID=3342640 RepID=UPI0035D8D02B